MSDAIIFIPARFGAQRLPGKPLLKETGKYLIQHVYENMLQSKRAADVVVATDDQRIAEAVQSFGGKYAMTSPSHISGTDRVAEAAQKWGRKAPIVLNVQGDEPLMHASGVDRLIEAMAADPSIRMGTLAYRLSSEEVYANPNAVKVVVDRNGFSLYFSRAPIPHIMHNRESLLSAGQTVLKHLGVYAFRSEFLPCFTSWPPTPLEQTERLEQLRALENGVPLKVLITEHDSIGIDTPEDYRRFVERIRGEGRRA